MTVQKRIVSTASVKVKIKKVTLLSSEEFDKNKYIIPAVNDWWWLSSAGNSKDEAMIVLSNGSRDHEVVDFENGGIRPVLIGSFESLNREDKFDFANYTWTVLSDNYALCDSLVGESCFRCDWSADDANVYKASDIKKWLNDWAVKNEIIYRVKLNERK